VSANKRTQIALIVGVLLLAFALSNLSLFERIDYQLQDAAQRLGPLAVPADDRVIVVAIDDLSLAADSYHLGKWAWPRRVYEPVVNYLARAGTRAIGFDLYFTIEDVSTPADDQAFVRAVMRAGNSCQAAAATDRRGVSMTAAVREEILDRFSVDCLSLGHQYSRLIAPFPSLLDACDCLGQLNAPRDVDGVKRRIHMLAGAEGVILPCLGLAMWLWEKELTTEDIRCAPGRVTVEAEGLTIPIDNSGRAQLRFGTPDRLYVPFSSVLHAELAARAGVDPDWRGGSLPPVEPEMFRNKFVILAVTASGLFDLVSTPLGGATPGVEIQAAALENILADGFLTDVGSGWSWLAATILLCCVVVALRRISTWIAVVLAIFVILGYAATMVFLVTRGFWVSSTVPLLSVVLGTGGQVLVMYLAEGRERRRYRQTFSRYVSRQVVEELLRQTDDIELRGEKREVTVLFCDIRGFTTLSESKAPEEVVEILDQFLGAMVEEVFAQGGTLDKFLGDGMMVFYGAPGYQDDHADRAVRTALAMLERLERLNREWVTKGWPELRLGIGMNSGPAIVGSIGSKERMEYTAIGDTVNTASRVQSLNKELNTRILATKATVESVRGDLRFRSLGTRTVRGRQQHVELFEPVDPLEGQNA
jgi:adenylate cyclase